MSNSLCMYDDHQNAIPHKNIKSEYASLIVAIEATTTHMKAAEATKRK